MQLRDTRNGEWLWVYNAVIKDPHLTAGEKLIYASLSTFGGCSKINPSYKTIAGRANLKERIAKSAVKRLVDIGYLSVEKSKGGSKNDTNIYNMLKAPKGCLICTGAQNDIRGVHKKTRRGVYYAPKLDNELDKYNKIAKNKKILEEVKKKLIAKNVF